MAALGRHWSSFAHRFRTDDRGGAAILYAGSLTALVGFTGLAVDVGDWYVTSQQLKNAADGAAYAVAIRGETESDQEALRTVAFAAARRSGFQGGLECVSLTRPSPAHITHLPNDAPDHLRDDVASDGWEVTLTQRNELLFSSMLWTPSTAAPTDGVLPGCLSGEGITLQAASVSGAGEISDGTPRCLVGLERTAGAAAVRSNGASFTLSDGCGIHANADMVVNGNNQTVASAMISVVGNFESGAVTPSRLSEGVRAYNDPYADIDIDSSRHTCTHDDMLPVGTGGNVPTVYDATGRADRTFVFCGRTDFRSDTSFVGPALYVFKDSFDISNATVSGTDVTFILADMSPDAVKVTGNGGLGITAPRLAAVEALPGSKDDRTTPRGIMTPWIGIALYGDRDTFTGGTAFDLDTASFGGTFNLDVDGVVYMPAAGLSVKGDVAARSGSCMRVLARQIEVSGNVTLGGADCADLFGDAVRDLTHLVPRLYY